MGIVFPLPGVPCVPGVVTTVWGSNLLRVQVAGRKGWIHVLREFSRELRWGESDTTTYVLSYRRATIPTSAGVAVVLDGQAYYDSYQP